MVAVESGSLRQNRVMIVAGCLSYHDGFVKNGLRCRQRSPVIAGQGVLAEFPGSLINK